MGNYCRLLQGTGKKEQQGLVQSRGTGWGKAQIKITVWVWTGQSRGDRELSKSMAGL